MNKMTQKLIKDFEIKKLGYDMMGYSKQGSDLLTFHHLIISRNECKELGIGDGYEEWNGSILYTTPHQYLHLIEAKDYELFLAITNEILEEKVQGYIGKENLRYIDDCLSYFEREHSSDRTRKGKSLIKEQYLQRNHFMI